MVSPFEKAKQCLLGLARSSATLATFADVRDVDALGTEGE